MMGNYEEEYVLVSYPVLDGERWVNREYMRDPDEQPLFRDADADGYDWDYTYIEEDEWPKKDEVDKHWLAYEAYVFDTGEDPLDNYYVSHTYKRLAAYTLVFRESLGGPFLIRWKRGRAPYEVASAKMPPPWVCEYFLLTNGWFMSSEPDDLSRRPLNEITETGETVRFDMAHYLELLEHDPRVRLTKTRHKKLPFYFARYVTEETCRYSKGTVKRRLREIIRKHREDRRARSGEE